MKEQSKCFILEAVEIKDVPEADAKAEEEAEEVLVVKIGMRERKVMDVGIVERRVTRPKILHRVEVLGFQHDLMMAEQVQMMMILSV